MKKIYLTLGLGVLFLGANAQQFQIKTNTAHKKTTHANWASRNNTHVASTYSVTIDTLNPGSIMAGGCATGLGLYQAYADVDSGYDFGASVPLTFTQTIAGTVLTVTATTVEIAQKYNVGGSAATITTVLVIPGAGNGGTTTTKSRIYAESSDAPGAVLGTSSTVPMSSYSVAIAAQAAASSYFAGMVSYSFATAVSVAANANFYASVTVPKIGTSDHDTMGVMSTVIGCAAADSLSWTSTTYTAPGYPAQTNWAPVEALFGGGSANNLDLMIFPVIDITSAAGINNYVSHGDLTIYAASPNPANTTININFSVAKSSAVEVQVFDVTGKMVKSVKNSDVVTGKNAISVDVSNLEAGSYMYSINANGNKMFSKFVVTK